jgi:hypothetical protein
MIRNIQVGLSKMNRHKIFIKYLQNCKYLKHCIKIIVKIYKTRNKKYIDNFMWKESFIFIKFCK